MKGVQHVSTRCSEGFVAWYQPSGALRISFNSHTALPSDRLLETCFTATSHMSTMAIALETHGGKDGGLKRLVTLDLDRPATQKEVCLRTSSPITLYVESSPGDLSATLGNLRIQYDVTTVNAKKVDDMEGMSNLNTVFFAHPRVINGKANRVYILPLDCCLGLLRTVLHEDTS